MKCVRSFRLAVLRLGIALLWLPAAAFWRFAARRSALQTKLDNEKAAHDRH